MSQKIAQFDWTSRRYGACVVGSNEATKHAGCPDRGREMRIWQYSACTPLAPRRSRLPMCVPAPLAVTLVWVLAEGVITRWINSSTPTTPSSPPAPSASAGLWSCRRSRRHHTMEQIMKLTDTQLVLLSRASQRPDRCAEIPPNLKGGVAQKFIAKLLNGGLVEEIRAEARHAGLAERR